MIYTYSKTYPVLSNIIYFLLAIYSFFVGINVYYSGTNNSIIVSIILFLFSLFAILTGSFSINYHLKTPSWEIDPHQKDDKKYTDSLKLDQGFAITIFIYGLIALIFLVGYTFNYKFLFLDINFWMGIIFAIGSIISFVIAYKFNDDAHQNCDKEQLGCFKNHQHIYNMYHSAWHLLSGISGIFWVLVIKNFAK